MKTLPFYLTNQSGYKNFNKKGAQAIRPENKHEQSQSLLDKGGSLTVTCFEVRYYVFYSPSQVLHIALITYNCMYFIFDVNKQRLYF